MVLTQSLFYVFLMCSLLLLIYTFPSGLDAIRTPESAQSLSLLVVVELLRGKGAADTLTSISAMCDALLYSSGVSRFFS